MENGGYICEMIEMADHLTCPSYLQQLSELYLNYSTGEYHSTYSKPFLFLSLSSLRVLAIQFNVKPQTVIENQLKNSMYAYAFQTVNTSSKVP